MAAAVFLICTTLVTNAASGTTATIDCPSQEQADVAELTNSFDNFSFRMLNEFIEPAAAPPAETVKAPDAPPMQAKTKPVVVVQTITKPRHIREAFNAPQRHHKSWRRAHVMPTGVAEVRPDSPPSLWDKLKQLPLFNLAQNSD